MGRRGPQSVSELLVAALPPGGRERLLSVEFMQLKWAQAVGAELACRSEPAAFDQGVLTVRVLDAAWGKVIVRLQNRIARQLNERLGAAVVKQIRFVRDAVRLQAPGPAPTASPREVESRLIREAAAAVRDAELRQVLIRTAERYLGAQSARRRSL